MNIYAMKKPKRVNAVSVTLFGIAVVLGYAIWFLVPLFWPVFQLTGIMKGACNDAYRELDNQRVIQNLLRESKRTRLRVTEDNFRLTRIQYTEDELAQVAKEDYAKSLFQKRGKECVLELWYEDEYEWPLIGRKTHFTFEREVRTPLDVVKWEKGCTCVTTSRR